MSSLNLLPVTALTPIIRVYDYGFFLQQQALERMFHTVFTAEHGFIPPETFIREMIVNNATEPVVVQIEWPPLPAETDLPNYDALYEKAVSRLADEITSSILRRRSTLTEPFRFQVNLCYYQQSPGVFVSKPFVFEISN